MKGARTVAKPTQPPLFWVPPPNAVDDVAGQTDVVAAVVAKQRAEQLQQDLAHARSCLERFGPKTARKWGEEVERLERELLELQRETVAASRVA